MSVKDDTNLALEMLGRISEVCWNTTVDDGHVTLFHLHRDAPWQTQWLVVIADRYGEVEWSDSQARPTDESLKVAVARLAGQDD